MKITNILLDALRKERESKQRFFEQIRHSISGHEMHILEANEELPLLSKRLKQLENDISVLNNEILKVEV